MQHAARHYTHCNALQHTATTCCNTLQSHPPIVRHVTHINKSRHILTNTSCHTCKYASPGHCNTLHCTAQHCTTLHHTATHYNTLQHTATRCNNTATCCNTQSPARIPSNHSPTLHRHKHKGSPIHRETCASSRCGARGEGGAVEKALADAAGRMGILKNELNSDVTEKIELRADF